MDARRGRYRPRPRGHAVLRLARIGYAKVGECLETHGISSKDADFSSNTVTVSKRFRCRRGCPWRGNFRGLLAEDGARRTVGMLFCGLSVGTPKSGATWVDFGQLS
jgi:hypothetical protein